MTKSAFVQPAFHQNVLGLLCAVFILSNSAVSQNLLSVVQFEYRDNLEVRITDLEFDNEGNFYMLYRYHSPEPFDMDPGPGIALAPGTTEQDLNGYVLSRFTPEGEFVWGYPIIAPRHESYQGISVLDDGVVFFGSYVGSSLKLKSNSKNDTTIYSSSSNKTVNCVVKYSLDGHLIWFKTEENSGSLQINEIRQDVSGKLYVIGSFKSAVDFSWGSNTILNSSNDAGFVARYSSSFELFWVRDYQGNGFCTPQYIYCNDLNKVTIAGTFNGTVDFDLLPSTVDFRNSIGAKDVFISMIESNGKSLWTQTIGGVEGESLNSMDCDPDNTIYISGSFSQDIELVSQNIPQLSSEGERDAFVASLNGFDGKINWIKSIGGKSNDNGAGIFYDFQESAIWWHGHFTTQADLFPGSDTLWTNAYPSPGNVNHNDRFLIKLNLSGEPLDIYTLFSKSGEAYFNARMNRNDERILCFGHFGGSGEGIDVDYGDRIEDLDHGFQPSQSILIYDTEKLLLPLVNYERTVEASRLVIYPNPVNEEFRIIGLNGSETIILRSSKGTIISQLSHRENYSLNEFANGIYFVDIIGKNETKTFKLIKME